MDHYEANGWVQGRGKPIKDWKAAVRTWEKNGINSRGSPKAANGKFDGITEWLEREEPADAQG